MATPNRQQPSAGSAHATGSARGGSKSARRKPRLPRIRFCDYYADALAKLLRMGLTLPLIERLRKYGLLATDNVTGFHEARFGRARFATLRNAIRHMQRTGEQVFYVEMDLQNLGGFNAALGHTRANAVFAKIATILRTELTATASESVFFRHGGDEMSAFLIDTTEEAVRAGLERARTQVARLARRCRLDTLPHPKHPNDPRWSGIGVHGGICRLRADHAHDPTRVFRQADTELERQKRQDLEPRRDPLDFPAVAKGAQRTRQAM